MSRSVWDVVISWLQFDQREKSSGEVLEKCRRDYALLQKKQDRIVLATLLSIPGGITLLLESHGFVPPTYTWAVFSSPETFLFGVLYVVSSLAFLYLTMAMVTWLGIFHVAGETTLKTVEAER